MRKVGVGGEGWVRMGGDGGWGGGPYWVIFKERETEFGLLFDQYIS